MLDRLVSSKLATIQHETIESGDQTIEIGRIIITNAGRLALETLRWPEAHSASFVSARRRCGGVGGAV
jgi:hypothetical protein